MPHHRNSKTKWVFLTLELKTKIFLASYTQLWRSPWFVSIPIFHIEVEDGDRDKPFCKGCKQNNILYKITYISLWILTVYSLQKIVLRNYRTSRSCNIELKHEHCHDWMQNIKCVAFNSKPNSVFSILKHEKIWQQAYLVPQKPRLLVPQKPCGNMLTSMKYLTFYYKQNKPVGIQLSQLLTPPTFNQLAFAICIFIYSHYQKY